MRKLGSIIGGGCLVVIVIVLFLVLIFGLEWLGLAWKRYFEPKHRSVERQVFKETRSYNEGVVQQLADYRLQYLQAETEQDRKAILSTVRHQFGEYDENRLSPELSSFLRKAKYGPTSMSLNNDTSPSF